MRLSIITVVFNRESTISRALQSIRDQSYKDVQLVIIDGASTDNTVALAQQFVDDKKDIFLSEPDDGLYHALNKGIKLATGDVIGFMHSDDVFTGKHALKRLALEFSNPDVDAVYGDLQYACKNDLSKIVRYWRSGSFSRTKLYFGWMVPHPTFFMRREKYMRLGSFSEKFTISADYEAILRYFVTGVINAVYIPEVIVTMSVGGVSNKSLPNIIQKMKEDYRIIRNYKLGGFLTLFLKSARKIFQFFNRVGS